MSKEKVEAKSLFDYIDNLQQAKDKLQNDYQNVVDIINELQQENKQLKGILQEIYERAINTNITSLDFRDYILQILGDKKDE